MNVATFLRASLASRAFSFLLVGILFRLFGAPIKAFIDKYLMWVAGGFIVAVVGGFLIASALTGGGEKTADKCSGATLESIGQERRKNPSTTPRGGVVDNETISSPPCAARRRGVGEATWRGEGWRV